MPDAPPDPRPTSRGAEWFGALLSAAGALLLAAWSVRLWSWRLSFPFAYESDALYYEGMVKGTLDHGWYLENPDLGAPFGLSTHDFPVVGGDSVQLLIVKALGLFTQQPFVVTNLFFLLTFPLTAASAFAALRWRRVPWGVSIAGGMIFAVAPFHFLHGVVHLFFASYQLVPLACAMVLTVLADEALVRRRPDVAGWRAYASWHTAGMVLLCAGIASALIYYALFAMLLLGAAGLARGLLSRSWRALVHGIGSAALIGIVALAHQLPTFLYRRANGPNPLAAARVASDSEFYGSKLIQLLLPPPGHRIDAFAALTKRYLDSTRSLGEPDNMLGLVAAVGFLWLLVVGLAGAAAPGRRAVGTPEERNAAFAVLLAFVFTTSSGFSTVLAYLVTPQFRSWGRIGIHLAFFSLLAALLLVDRALRRVPAAPRRFVAPIALVVLVVVAALDQVTPAFTPDRAAIEAAVRNDANFAQDVRRRLPEGSMVLQLPYSAYPENPPTNRLHDYDLLRPYLHTDGLRWSYAAIKGRPEDWMAEASTYPLPALLTGAVAAGFRGVVVDRFGYADAGADVGDTLATLLGEAAVSSGDGRLHYWDLEPLATRLAGADRAALTDATLRPVRTTWDDGAFEPETDGTSRWRWLRERAALRFDNPSDDVRRLVFSAVLQPGTTQSSVTLVFPDGHEETPPTGEPAPVQTFVVDVPPGRSQLTILSNGPPVPSGADPRGLHTRVADPVIAPKVLCDTADARAYEEPAIGTCR